MKYTSTMLSVENIEKSTEFYTQLLKLTIILDLGKNVSFLEGIALQEQNSWYEFINKDITYQGNDAELYFETENLDDFLVELKNWDVELVHELITHDWGQRVIRFYDPDYHIIEVGESLELVCRRFLEQGLSIEETAEKSLMPIEFIKNL